MRLPFLYASVFVFAACSAPSAPPAPAPSVDAELRASIEGALRELGPSIQAAIWLGEPGQPPRLAIDETRPMPVASAIKVAYLVELFAAFPDALDAPMPGIDAVLADADNPAIAHFTAEQRENARTSLGGATVRRIGEAMITGKGVDNATYNLAANLVTAHFGGPAALEQRLHARSPDWAGLRVRRYMLADRTTNGDNTATAAALASVHGHLANGSVPNAESPQPKGEARSAEPEVADARRAGESQTVAARDGLRHSRPNAESPHPKDEVRSTEAEAADARRAGESQTVAARDGLRHSRPNVDPRAVAAARAVLASADDAAGRHFRKGGSLDSEPVTRVEAGWHEGPAGKLVHVVMLSQAGVAPDQRAVAGKQLARSVLAIEQMLVRDWSKGHPW